MRSVWRVALLLVGAGLASGCSGLSGAEPGSGPGGVAGKYAACTDISKCCSQQEQVTCVGDPDSAMKCTCQGLWSCDLNQKKCQQPLPVPPGGGTWSCTWTESSFVCGRSIPPGTAAGPNPQDLPGGSGWACRFNDQEHSWECTAKSPPNPSNQPAGTGVWDCKVVGTELVCERTDAPDQPPVGTGAWKCETVNGKTLCTKLDENGGLPPGGTDWKCNLSNVNGVPTWTCYGSSGSNPGGNSGWTCTQVNEMGTWKCTKPNDSGDIPPSGTGTSGSGTGTSGSGTSGSSGSGTSGSGTGTGTSGTGTSGSGSGTSGSGGTLPGGGGFWACVKGSEFGGTTCELLPKEPTPPTPTPKPGDACIIGEKMWCDGLQYCGWGQVICDPATGKWKTKKNSDGVEILDCQELATGARPNTTCACYHFYFNPACCERPDCIVPAGTNGQVCPASKGGLCDYCDPQHPECKEVGSKCIVTNAHETFCGRLCSASSPCPAGYQCMVVKLSGAQTTSQCVPTDLSCYY